MKTRVFFSLTVTVMFALLMMACPLPVVPTTPGPTTPGATDPGPTPPPTPTPQTGIKTYPLVKKDINPEECYGPVKCFGDKLFVSDQNYGLVIFDVSNPDNPVKLSTFTHPGYASADERPLDYAVTGHYLYYLSMHKGIYILDIADIAHPTLLKSIPNTTGTFYQIKILGDYAFLSNSAQGLVIYDISNPTDPINVGTCAIPSDETTRAIELAGNLIYLLSSQSNGSLNTKIRVIDVSVKSQPTIQATISEPGAESYRMYLSGNRLYTWGDVSLLAFNVANPNSILKTDSLDFSSGEGGVSGVVAAGNALYVATYRNLRLVDATDPTNLTINGIISSNGIYGLTMGTNHIYATGGSSFALNVIDVTTPFSPVQTCQYDEFGTSYKIAMQGSYLFITTSTGLLIYNTASPTNPTIIAQLKNQLTSARDLVIEGNYAYAACGGAFCIVNIEDKSNPVVVSSYAESLSSIAIAGNYAYLGTYHGLIVLDITNKSTPVKVTGFDTTVNYAGAMCVNGGTLIVGGTNGYKIVDISNPALPVLLHTSSINSYAYSPRIYQSKYLYVVYGNQNLYRIFDITDKSNPVSVYESETIYNFRSITITGDKMYTVGLYAKDYQDIDEWNISDPLNPIRTARSKSTLGNAGLSECLINGQYLYAISGFYGLHIFQTN